MHKRNDWGFWTITLFLTVGSLGGWLFLFKMLGVLDPAPVALSEVADSPGMPPDGWEPLGSDSQGRDFLRRTASNGDIERLTIMPDGVGLYVRCEAPDPFPDVAGCVKIVLRPPQ